MTGFEAYYISYVIKSFFFTYKKGDPTGILFSKNNKIREKCIDLWNGKHLKTDAVLFQKIEEKFQSDKKMALLFASYYLLNDGKCHPSVIFDTDYHYFEKMRDDIVHLEDILKSELAAIRQGKMSVMSSNLVTQAAIELVYGLKKTPRNALEEAVIKEWKIKIKNLLSLLRYLYPHKFDKDQLHRYIRLIVKKEIKDAI